LSPLPAARPGVPFLAPAALLLAALAAPQQGSAEAGPIDGIVALVGSAPGDEGTATPLLASDVALHAVLGALLSGPVEAPAPPRGDEFTAAGRQAILLALLVREARQSGEEADPAVARAIVARIAANAGGADAFAALLASLGATPADAELWAGDLALAVAQAAYMREQVEPPSDKDVQRRFAEQDHPFVGHELKDVKGRLRELMITEQLSSALGAMLGQALREGAVRFVRP